LRKQCHCTSRTTIVRQEGGHGDDDEDQVFAEGGPVERVVRVVAGLGQKDSSAIFCVFEVLVRGVCDDVAGLFIVLMEVFDDVGGLGRLLFGVHGGRWDGVRWGG
jgi:hypothetical protein